jgi:hypothetical protein
MTNLRTRRARTVAQLRRRVKLLPSDRRSYQENSALARANIQTLLSGPMRPLEVLVLAFTFVYAHRFVAF